MNSVRRKRIVRLALDYLQFNANEAEQRFAHDVEDEPLDFTPSPTRIELEVQSGKIILAPTDDELQAIVGEGKGGNWRTREILVMALTFMQENLEDIQHDYYYQGEVERFVDTHVTFEDENFLCPTAEEITEILDNGLDAAVNLLPHVPTASVGWDVYDIDEESGHYEWIDTVFYDANCDRQYVRNGLIGHDGYNPSIAIVC
jgi:ribosomal protein L18E